MSDAGNVTAKFSEPERQGKERRLVLRLLDYWRGIAGDRAYPLMNDVHSDDLADMWPFCFILDIDEHKKDPVLRYVGEEIIECYGGACENLHLSELRKNSLLDCATLYVDEVVRKSVPISYGNSFKGQNGQNVLCRSILLPLSDNGETVTLLLGGANYMKNPKLK